MAERQGTELPALMDVLLTFDIEVWCNDWDRLDALFPACFERYIYGRSKHGEYALPETLAILNRHGLRGVFFVEPLFAARFGVPALREIVSLIQGAGQEVQLHLHPEWTDEACEPLIENCQVKRQHLSYYTLEEQTALVAHGLRLLAEAGAGPVSAFRAGSYAANRDTLKALGANGLLLDTSFNMCHAISGQDLRQEHTLTSPLFCEGVSSYPVSVFRDGFGKLRPAQVGACSAAELLTAMDAARALGHQQFVIVSHNFEMLRAGSSTPDFVVARRFEALCAALARASHRVRGFGHDMQLQSEPTPLPLPLPSAGFTATLRRHGEQLRRRLSS